MKNPSKSLMQDLRNAKEPALRYFALNHLFEVDPDYAEGAQARMELPDSEIILRLAIPNAHVHPYSKWDGAHWSLVSLAELGYPYVDPRLTLMQEQVYQWLFSNQHQKSIKKINGLVRRCASQEGNALFTSVKLNLVNEQTPQLVSNLLQWQWPDGGWNCDKREEAHVSSFWETWTPLRGLVAWRDYNGEDSQELNTAINNAAELFLKRHLFLGQHNNQVMQPDFVKLHHPSYWKYDILVGLELMRAVGKLKDDRCNAALDLLENKMQVDGSLKLEKRLFQASNPAGYAYSPVDWGERKGKQGNPWLTIRALAVLRDAERIQLS